MAHSGPTTPARTRLLATLRACLGPGVPVLRQDDGSIRIGFDDDARVVQFGPPPSVQPTGAETAERASADTIVQHLLTGADAPARRASDATRVLVDGLGRQAEATARHLRALGVARVLDGAYVAEAVETAALSGTPTHLDAVVLLGSGPIDPDRAHLWRRRGIPHVPLDLRADRAVVGPLVIPGRSSCLGCHEFARIDRDRSWALNATRQRGLTTGRRADEHARPTVALLATALAATLVIAVLEGDTSMAGVSTELTQNIPELVHRFWPRHPRCACASAATEPGLPPDPRRTA